MITDFDYWERRFNKLDSETKEHLLGRTNGNEEEAIYLLEEEIEEFAHILTRQNYSVEID